MLFLTCLTLSRFFVYFFNQISPLQLEEVIKRHPGVAEVCVVGIPHKDTMETPVAIIQKKNGSKVEPHEIFKLVRGNDR